MHSTSFSSKSLRRNLKWIQLNIITMSELLNDDHEDKYWISVSAQDPGSLLRRSAPLLRDAGQRGVQALSVLLLCCTYPSSAVLVLLVLYLFVGTVLVCVVLYLCVYCSTWLCGAVLVRLVLCLFLLYSTLPYSALLCFLCSGVLGYKVCLYSAARKCWVILVMCCASVQYPEK